MKKQWIALLCALTLLLGCTLALADGRPRILDRANLFTASEEEALTQKIEAFQKKTNMDFVLLTSSESHEGSAVEVADGIYERGGYGLDEENSGILYYIDMADRYHYLSTTGKMQDYMTDERIEEAINTCQPYLTRGDYAGAAEYMIDLVQDYVKAGIPEGQYRYDIVTGQQLTARHKALTGGELALAAVIGLAAALIFMKSVQHGYLLKGSTYEYDFRGHSSVDITNRVDQYINTTTTRVRKPDPPESRGGGSFGGSSGGSGVHTSSSGTSHGGGGGHF